MPKLRNGSKFEKNEFEPGFSQLAVRRSTTVRGGGPFKCYIMLWGGWGVSFHRKKHYEGVRFNVISITSGWGSNSLKKSVSRNT